MLRGDEGRKELLMASTTLNDNGDFMECLKPFSSRDAAQWMKKKKSIKL
jgi:hypothetical protein